MRSPFNASDVKTPLVIARMAAAFFSFVYLIAFMMFYGSPGYGMLFVLYTTVPCVALLAFACLPRQAYAVDIVRSGALALSGSSIILGVVKLMSDLWDPIAMVLGLIVIGLLAFMAHEAHTWEQEE
jgi:hypothetical protein